MAIDFSVVKTFIYNWAIANIPQNMPAIWLYPNAPRPTVDYITLYLSTITQIGWDWNNGPDGSGIAPYVGDREFVVQIQGYGGDPMTVLQNLRTSLQKQTVLDSLNANGIVFYNWGPVNDITELVDSRYENRATMDINFRIADIYTDNLGFIGNVNLREILKDSAGTTIFDETVTITTI